MIKMLFSEIVSANSKFKLELINNERLNLKVLSNITLNQLAPILEYTLRKDGVNAYVDFGEYDNIVQESKKDLSNHIPIIFWELANIKESFVYELESKDNSYFETYIHKIQNELSIIFSNLSTVSVVLFNKFSHLAFSLDSIEKTEFEIFVNTLNDFLVTNAPSNFVIIDVDKTIAKTSIANSIDWRGFYATKSLYSVPFFKTYSDFIKPIFLSISGKAKKVLVFDCDNTLWKGILGEDGIENIELSEKHNSGKYFKEIQLIAKSLSRKGILLGICSKNNFNDVEEVFDSREDLTLKKDDFVIKKINWIDKASNIIDISRDLNVGIDSIIFIDDSEFELNLINEKLPQVQTIPVPRNLYQYPILLKSKAGLFFSLNRSNEDLGRSKMYLDNIARNEGLKSSQNIDDYLGSLNIQLCLSNKDKSAFDRITQLTQKTNQFNLTTKRYATGDMGVFYNSNNHDVFSLEVKDKFGEFGITGVAIISYENEEAFIDTFLLSCRILGRNIEKVFFSEILRTIVRKNVKKIKALYIPTIKNAQVESFYDEMGFTLKEEVENSKKYFLESSKINNINFDKYNYISVLWKTE